MRALRIPSASALTSMATAIDGDDCDGNDTYTDYQGEVDEDVTAVVRGTPAHLRKYMVRPGYDDMKRRGFENDDEDDSD
jgi:hypothetical protein